MVFSRLEFVMKQKNVSWKELAQAIGMTEQGLRIARKRESLQSSVIQKICNYLKVPYDYLSWEGNNYGKEDVDTLHAIWYRNNMLLKNIDKGEDIDLIKVNYKVIESIVLIGKELDKIKTYLNLKE